MKKFETPLIIYLLIMTLLQFACVSESTQFIVGIKAMTKPKFEVY